MKHIHRCMVHTVFSTMQLVQCYICVQLKTNTLKFIHEFILQLCIYAKAVRILAKGYLPISLVTPLEIEGNVRVSKRNSY